MIRREIVVGIVVAVSLIVASVAVADRAPNRVERAGILEALNLEGRGPDCGTYPPGSCRIYVRVSTADSHWAAVFIGPSGKQKFVQPDVATVHLRRGKWSVHQVGNGGGCGVPGRVQRDLRLACY